MKKNTTWIALVMAACMIFSACGSPVPSEAENSKESNEPVQAETKDGDSEEASSEKEFISINVGLGDDFGSFVPIGDAAGGGGIYWRQAVYEKLFVPASYGGEIEGCIAKSITKVEDRTYNIEIYDYVYDSAGNHITADDVVWCYSYAKELGLAKMFEMESIEKVDDYTVKFTISSNNIGVYEDILCKINIISQKAFEESGDNMASMAIGTGPYEITNWVSGSTLELTKRDYWQHDESLIPAQQKANVDQLTYKAILDPAQMVVAMQTGEIDAIAYLQGSTADYFINEDGTSVDGYYTEYILDPLIYFLSLNMSDQSVFADNPQLRQAIFYAIDAQGLLDVCLDGKGEVCYTLGSTLYGDFQEQWKQEDYFWYDLDHAKELLAESGYVQERPLRIMTQEASPWKEIATLIQSYIIELGLDCELLVYDTNLWNDYSVDRTQFDMMIYLAKSPDVLPNLYTFVLSNKSRGENTVGFYQSEEMEEMISELCTSEGHTDENLIAFHEYMKENMGNYGLVNSHTYCVSREGLFSDLYWNGWGWPQIWASTLAE